jgi:hypothetical protein
MRTNDSVGMRSVWSVVVAVAALGLTAAGAAAQSTVHLIAAPVTQTVTLPNGSTVSVPMWGYALDGNCPSDPPSDPPSAPTVTAPTTTALTGCEDGVVNNGEVVTVPGPRIVVPPGDSSLTILLTNRLAPGEPTSIVIPGQPFKATPAKGADGRVRSMTSETLPGETGTYVFDGLKPGTFLYQSGSHPAVQVQMGLYGAMTRDESDGNAYANLPYGHEALLLYSEIDPALHEAVANDKYGPGKGGPTSTIRYRPTLFLINGESYTDSMASLAAGTAGETTLLRFLNAGLRTHVPLLADGTMKIVAEDGNKLPFAKEQSGVMLAAGKTHDVVWTPAAAGEYSVYDRALGLNAPGQGTAGMFARLKVGAVAGGMPPSVVAVDDAYTTAEGNAVNGNVITNDMGASGAALATGTHDGTLNFSGGSFTYAPRANFSGVDSFTYQATAGSQVSAPALVMITVTPVRSRPVAIAQVVGVDKSGNVSVTLSGTDPDADPLQYYVADLPSHGELSYIDPLTKVQTPLLPANQLAGSSPKAVPGGIVIYTPAVAASDTLPLDDLFHFVAYDGSGALSTDPTANSSPASVTATVFADADSPGADVDSTVNLTVNGGAVGQFRWTLEEDLTHQVIPGQATSDTLAVSFHRSYMPVVAAGTQDDPLRVNSSKRYFVSVLPTVGDYSNGGAPIAIGQTNVNVTVAKLPLPVARIRVRVFQDNAPLDGMWSADEPGLPGFQVTIDDAGGTYGMSGGHQSTDAFGNKLGTTYKPCASAACDPTEVATPGDGFVLTDADGYATIDNLVMGKYTVKVRAPGGNHYPNGDTWIQTTTIEGGPGIDAWVKPNEPQFFTEFGPPGPHVEVGFARLTNTLATTGGYTISGRVTNLRMSRPIEVAQFSGAPFKHTRPWVALNSGATGGTLLYAQPTKEDGSFTIEHVPNGSYQVVVFDSALDLIIGSAVVNVAGAAKNVGDVAVFNWFTNLYSYVFEDRNGDGIHDANEPGIPDQALNIRFRDGSIYQSLSTDSRGFKAFNEVFPFFAWMVAEVDYARYHSTGLTVVVDDGGDANAPCTTNDWRGFGPGKSGFPTTFPEVPCNTLKPQQQESGLPYRTESGAETPFLLLEGFQGFIGQSTVMMWGKAPYKQPGSIPEDVDVAPLGDFPGPGDVDGNNDGKFNTDHFNGGIAGIVHYGITRAENDPRWAAAENWEPGVSDVRVQLWDENRTHLLNEVTTDNWNNSLPEGCRWPNGQPYVYRTGPGDPGRLTDCFDGLRNFNQARPALFDGGYAFSTILVDSYDPAHPKTMTFNNPISCDGQPAPCTPRRAERPIPAGRYVVKIIVPPGYKLQKEEDKNVDFGDTYVPRQFWLSGTPLADAGGGPGEAQPAPTVEDNALIAPFCVGQLHEVPETLSLFPGQQAGAFAGEMRPLCDAKLVTLRDGQQAAPDFHLFTEAPVAGHVYGMVLDDTTNEFDPNAPTFGEKYAVPFIGVSLRDWQGNEITRTYSDQYGMYDALVPTTYTINPPEPSGVSPSILAACINPPTMPGPGGTTVPDPHFQKQYSHFCYPLQYLPGKTTYLDTPVVPTGAFTGNGTLPVDAELPNHTPVIATVTGPNPDVNGALPDPTTPYGPYVVDRGAGNAAARTIVISSVASLTGDGLTEVPNPRFDGSGAFPKLIKRDYGFGPGGTVRLGDVPLNVVTWSNTAITAVVPTGLRTGQLSIDAGQSTCTVDTTPLSTLAGGITAAAGSLSVANGDGKKFALGTLIQVDSEAMGVTGGNRSTLAATLGTTASTLARDTLRVPHTLGAATGDGQIFTPAGYVSGSFASPIYVSVDSEVITLIGKSTTSLTSALGGGGFNLTLNVTAGTGSGRFAIGDYIKVDNETMLVVLPLANSITVARGQLGTSRVAHASGAAVVALDRFAVNRGVLGTAVVSHASGAAVVGDVLTVTRGQDGTTAEVHSAGATVGSYLKTCVTTDSHKSILGVTLSVATEGMHTARKPKTVSPGQSIQQAIDTATAGDLILVKPGVYEEMVVMTKPVRLQGAGAATTAINVVTTPAEKIQAWLDKVGNLLLNTSAPSYLLPNQPAMTAAPFQNGDVAAVVGDEGPGVLVLSRNFDTGSGQNQGRCLSGAGNITNDFATPAGQAYCLHNENYPSTPSAAYWRPNARIDGFSLIGASNAPGVLVNGYAHWLEVSNNKIYTNSGTYAGGVQIGHAGAAPPFSDENAQNDNVSIHNNMVAANAANETGGGGGIVLGTGSNNYTVKGNFVAANLAAGNGGGIAHIGRSEVGVIDGNTVIFNESFTQAIGTNGGGIFVGSTPAAAGAPVLGTGQVEVTNNLIQGNAASGGDGGGIALAGFVASDRIRVYNNVVANNVAGLAGGGISVTGVPTGGTNPCNSGLPQSQPCVVDITQNTVVNNDSTGTAGGAFTFGVSPSPMNSTPQPAGIAGRGSMIRVGVANSIVWHNRTFFFGECTTSSPCGTGSHPISGPPGTVFAEKIISTNPYWDLAALGTGAGGQFTPRSSVLTALSQPVSFNWNSGGGTWVPGGPRNYNVNGNSNSAPSFVSAYVNTDRRNAYVIGETNGEGTLISVPAALDEGGNFIRPQFGPLSLEDPNTQQGPFFGNYHLTSNSAVNGQALCGGGGLYGGSCLTNGSVPNALVTDLDKQPRATNSPERGADEVVAPVPTTPVPQR